MHSTWRNFSKNASKRCWNCNIWPDWFTCHQSHYCLYFDGIPDGLEGVGLNVFIKTFLRGSALWSQGLFSEFPNIISSLCSSHTIDHCHWAVHHNFLQPNSAFSLKTSSSKLDNSPTLTPRSQFSMSEGLETRCISASSPRSLFCSLFPTSCHAPWLNKSQILIHSYDILPQTTQLKRGRWSVRYSDFGIELVSFIVMRSN